MFDLKELEAFVAVIGSGNLSASARDLDLPKSTLSRRIRQLEANIGQSLLRRESNRLSPTEAGQVFYRYCHEILELAGRGQDALEELRGEVRGELVLRSHSAFTRGWFTRQVESFMERHPEVKVVLRTQTEPPRGDPGDDVCLWLGPLHDCPMRQIQLGSLSQGIYASPELLERHGEPRHPRELARYDWVDMMGVASDGVILHHPREGIYPLKPSQPSFRVDQFTLQGDAIVRGRGLGLMPHWLVALRNRHHPGAMQLCLPEWQGPALPVWLVHSHGQLPRRTRALIEHLKAGVPEAWNTRRVLEPVY
ncbi:LysR family transcriptional regulator [Marinobacter sp. JSM 1782161]|uniref:LysR family transcriptional regulator n=1 Tax=Marinobacter sp. JSM 1782161 TaxID=2685906 RepID=UPI00140203F5|nr:LysR family transcriptional regulator [Marinobacter sp. JSM 1782161]